MLMSNCGQRHCLNTLLKHKGGRKMRKNKEDVPEEFVAAHDIEGKQIIDDRGKAIGKVESIYIDPLTFNVKGVSIHNGSFKGSHFIDSSHISTLSEEGVVLLAAPIDAQHFEELYE